MSSNPFATSTRYTDVWQLRDFRDEAEKQAAATPPPATTPTTSFTGLREDEVGFVRALAAAWRLGHAPEASGGVKVWLPAVRLNSTHDVAAGMSVAPESGGGGDGEDGKTGAGGAGGRQKEEEKEVFNDAGEFECRIRYVVSSPGVVTAECDVSMPEQWPVIPRCVSRWDPCGNTCDEKRTQSTRFAK